MYTHAPTKALADLTPADVSRVYRGKAGRCACGCSGTYFPENIDRPTPDETATVEKILAKVKAGGGEWFGNGFGIVTKSRMFNVYVRSHE